MLLGALTLIAASVSGRVTAQVAQEYDTNARRIYSDAPEADFLARLLWRGQLNLEGTALSLALDYQGGAKLFYEIKEEHLLASQVLLTALHRLSPRAVVGTRATFRDMTQAEHTRDSQVLGATLFQQNAYALGPVDLGLEVRLGVHSFRFKPDELRPVEQSFSHTSPTLYVGLGFALATFHFGIEYGFEDRLFGRAALACEGDTRPCLQPIEIDQDRKDFHHTLEAELRYQTRLQHLGLIAELGYELADNASNSLGSSVRWHRLRLALSMRLPLDLSLHLLGRLQFTTYTDGVFLDREHYEPDADENENSLVIRLRYELFRELHLIAEVALYRNAFSAAGQEFRRETFGLGLAWSFSRSRATS